MPNLYIRLNEYEFCIATSQQWLSHSGRASSELSNNTGSWPFAGLFYQGQAFAALFDVTPNLTNAYAAKVNTAGEIDQNTYDVPQAELQNVAINQLIGWLCDNRNRLVSSREME